jgi:hypothetical protein
MINTKDIEIKGSGDLISKVIEPGNLTCTIHNVELRTPPYDKDAFDVVLHCEGPDMGEDFEGFFKDKNDESQGRYKGQVGRIRLSQYSFSNGTTKTGIKIDRDVSMLRALKSLCVELGFEKWLDAQHNAHDTVESLFAQFESDAPFKDVKIDMCISGKEYTNKGGYTNFDLFLPRISKKGMPYELHSKEESNLLQFDESVHLIAQKKAAPVTSFDVNEDSGDEFDI